MVYERKVSNNIVANNERIKNQQKQNIYNDKMKFGANFETVLKEQIEKNSGNRIQDGIKISKHAEERMKQRNIQFDAKIAMGIDNAIEKALQKGVKDIVVLDELNAFIVNVPSKTVVTAMSGTEMRENIFTNIDGAVIL